MHKILENKKKLTYLIFKQNNLLKNKKKIIKSNFVQI